MKLVVLIIFSCFSSCATINTSVLDTSKSLKKGESRLGLELVQGLDLTSLEIISESEQFEINDKKFTTNLSSAMVYSVGLFDNFEIGGKFSIANKAPIVKFYTKHRLNSVDDKFGIALIPGIHYLRSSFESITGLRIGFFGSSNSNSRKIDSPTIRSYGWEIPLLIDYSFDEKMTLYSASRLSYDYIFLDYDSRSTFENTDFLMTRLGFIAGLSFHFHKSYFRVEIGREGTKAFNSTFNFHKSFSFGVGFRI